jgi:hypothetical protein
MVLLSPMTNWDVVKFVVKETSDPRKSSDPPAVRGDASANLGVAGFDKLTRDR